MDHKRRYLAPLLEWLKHLEEQAALPDDKSEPHPIGRFQIGEVLGSGRFAIVVEAHDPSLNRKVALKLPRPELLVEDRLRDRFIREAKAAARLDHPGIVPVHEVIQAGDSVVYLVLGHVNGPTLEEWAEEHAESTTVSTLCEIMASLADAVQHAHDRQVLHLDLKPSNILIDPGNEPIKGVGQPRITDFGLARILDDARTQTTAIRAGSEGYMAPEQIAGHRQNLTPAADIWALGVVLYQLLAGRLPFLGTTAATTDQEPTSLRLLRPGVGRELEAVVLKCLEREPAKRYTTAQELANDLRAVLEGSPTKARPVGIVGRVWKKARKRPAVAVLGAIASLVVLLGPVAAVRYWDMVEQQKSQTEIIRLKEKQTTDAEFASALDRIRRRNTDRPANWIDDNLAEFKKAFELKLPQDDLATIRSDLAMTLGGSEWKLDRKFNIGYRIERLAYSPDGKYLVLGEGVHRDFDFFELTWVEAESKQLIRTTRIPKKWVQPVPGSTNTIDGVWSLEFTQDSRYLFVGTRSGWIHRVSVLDETERPISWKAHRFRLDKLVRSPDGKRLFSFCKTSSIIASWDIADPSQEIARSLIPVDTESLGVGFDNFNNQLILGTSLGDLFWFDPVTLQQQDASIKSNYTRHITSGNTYTQMAFSQFGFGVMGNRLELWLWDTLHHIRTCRLISEEGVFLGNSGVDNIAFEHTGQFVAMSLDANVAIWDISSNQLSAIIVPPPTEGQAKEMKFWQKGSEVAIPGDTPTIYAKTTPEIQKTIAIHPLRTTRFRLFRDCLFTIGTNADRPFMSIYKYDLKNNASSLVFSADKHVDDNLGVSSDWRSFAFSEGGNLHLIDLNGREIVRSTDGISQGDRIVFDPLNRGFWIVSLMKIILVDRDNSKILTELKMPRSPEDGISRNFECLSTNANMLIVSNYDGNIDLFAPESDSLSNSILIENDVDITEAAISQNGQYAVAGTFEGAVAVINVKEKSISNRWSAHPHQRITSLSLNPDASLLASGGEDGKLHIWQRKGDNWELFFDIPTDKKPVKQVQFDEEGKKLYYLLAGERGVRVWEMERFIAEMKSYGLVER